MGDNDTFSIWKSNFPKIKHIRIDYPDLYDYLPKDERDNTIYFNTALAYLGNDRYVYAIRDYVTTSKISDIIPGNDPKCNNSYEIGKNFHWNKWGAHAPFQHQTIILTGNHKKGIYDFPTINDPDNQGIFYDEQLPPTLQPQDIRLYYKNNRLYICTRDLADIYIYDYDYDNNSLTFVDTIKIYSADNNASIVYIDETNELYDITYLDWYYPMGELGAGVYYKNIKIGKEKYLDEVKSYNIPFNINYIISGLGSFSNNNQKDISTYMQNYGVLPLLSFGTPLVEYDSKKFGKCLIGVGHLKIHSDVDEYPYKDYSNVQIFRQNLYKDFKKYFGDKYIRHKGTGNPNIGKKHCFGYIYLPYFYVLFNDMNSMYLSDAFLPVNLDTDLNYRFSLIFPEGNIIVDDKLIVSAGEGDYRSIIMEFNVNEVLDSCIHDVQYLDMNLYQYFLFIIENDYLYIDTSLQHHFDIKNQEIPSSFNDILYAHKGGSNKNKYLNKYIEYKTKYIELKKYLGELN
ncbi:hypothetical protein QJ857_gp0545 [Tupanvirus soda lake]|uniref:Uncharacterized protein n=2 Tax=Tupanvirus TaxID=2094720 RepID=A0A6N1NVP3_9VIRU|nr:hypothetical protein QJ857_gp0545 [Tupanvirus soda lake]QKU35496.1 hypothetical protein [Tupanvirus soda lake]